MILRNCRLVGELTEGYQGEYGDIVVEGERIEGIYPCGEVAAEGREEVDFKGNYTLPGFIDIHVHLTLSGGDTLVDSSKTPVELGIDAYAHALDSLKGGFTTLRDVGASDKVVISLRDAVNKGKLVGPNIYASGRIITPVESGNDFFRGMYLETRNPDDMYGAVREVMKDGSDFIKLMGTGAIMNPGGIPGQTICLDDEYRNIVEAARFKNTYVAVHCHGTEAIKSAIRSGCRTIEHASMMDDECIELLKGQDSYAVPTLSAAKGLITDLPESSEHMRAKAEKILDSVVEGVTKAYKAGLKLGFATDQGITGLFHGDNGREFLLRRELLGMSTLDILKQATMINAEILGAGDRIGSIKRGKLADLVVVSGDPFEDISVLRDNVVKVVKSGRIV